MRRIVLQLQPAVTGHRLGDVDKQRVRHRVPAVRQQRVDDHLGVVAGGFDRITDNPEAAEEDEALDRAAMEAGTD